MLTLADITAAVQTCWATAAPLDVPCQFPGVPLDASRLSSWYEFWLTSVEEAPHRVVHGEWVLVMIDVHCFSRRRNKHHASELADIVRSALGQRTLPLTSRENPSIRVGTLRLREATLRDLTRESATQPPLPLMHVVVSLLGRAERGGDGVTM